MNQRVITTSGLFLVVLLALLVATLSTLVVSPLPTTPNFGITLPSPNSWSLSATAGKIINVVALPLLATGVYMINKHFGLVKTGQPLWASLFLPLSADNPLLSGRFSSAPLVCLLIMITMASLMSLYKRRNATRGLFFAATLISLGSMTQQALLLFIIPLILSAIEMKIMRFKETLAMIMGLIAPYWIALGMGLTPLSAFHRPEITTIFNATPPTDTFIVIIFTGILLLLTLLLTLNNGIKLYAGNSYVRNCNNVVNFFGITAAVGIMADFGNFYAYMEVFNIWVALQLAQLFNLWNLRRFGLLYWITQTLLFAAGITLLACQYL